MAQVGSFKYVLQSNSREIVYSPYFNNNIRTDLFPSPSTRVRYPISGSDDYISIGNAISEVLNDDSKWKQIWFYHNPFTTANRKTNANIAKGSFPLYSEFDPPIPVDANKIVGSDTAYINAIKIGEVGGPFSDISMNALPGASSLAPSNYTGRSDQKYSVNIFIFNEDNLDGGNFSFTGSKISYYLLIALVYEDKIEFTLSKRENKSSYYAFLNGSSAGIVGDDPFDPGGGTDTGGGNGDFDDTSVPIEIPDLPTISAASTGFISLFNPTLSQLNELASYLWSDLFEISGWKKLFADPMDAILGLSILPVHIPTSGPKEVKVGNIGTGKSLNVASTQFVEVDCGSINVNEYWGAYLDYSPYTQCQIYLPYVGTRPISVDEIMGKTVNVKYRVDILTGACCCFIKCGDSVLYTFNGQCSIPIPINSANYTSVINGIISVAASVGSMVATGGASAPLAIPHLASTVANQMKPNIEKSGAISGSGGVLNIQTPYLILTRPRQALPSKQNTFTGYPSFITVTLGELSGYTEVHSIHLENISATADELSEIETLLKGGVIF